MHKNGKTSKESGQSLVEVLIAISIGGIIIGSSVIAITLSLRSNVQNEAIKNATFLLSETIDRTRSIAQGDWSKLYNSTKATPTYIASDNGESIFINGTEGVLEEDISSGLIGHWKLDEASGTDAYDSSGNDNKGTLTGPIQAGVENCYSGGCLDFDGVDDYVIGDSNLGISGDAEFTMSTWIYWDDDSWSASFPSAMGNNSTGSVNTGLSMTFKEGRPALDFWNNRWRADDTLIVRTWYHVAVTKTPGVIGSTSKIYVDGVEVSGAVENSNSSPNITDAPPVIGRLDNSRWFNGLIDDARIYDRALSAEEVSQLYGSRAYNRSLSVENVNRNSTTGEVMEVGGSEDPSTQKVTGTITWSGGSTITTVEYMTRARNDIERITDWSDPTSYDSADDIIDTSTEGEIKLIIPDE